LTHRERLLEIEGLTLLGRRTCRGWPGWRLASMEAYLYGYPRVHDLEESFAFTEGTASFPFQAPLNTFGHARELLGPETNDP
jgi:hypothetical protein